MTAAVQVTYERPTLYPKQREALFHAERYGLVEASTKAGKTVACIVWLFEQAAKGKPGRNYWWVAPTFPVAKIAFRRMKRALPRGLFTPNHTELTLELGNGTVIWFKGADKPDSLYGEDVYAAVIDEASRCKEESWHAVRSTLTATRGPIRIIGNVKGRKNWAYQLARMAESGSPGMHYAKLTAYDAIEAGVLAADEVDDAKRTLPDAVFRELYLAEPSDDGGNPFGLGAIKRKSVDDLAPGPAVCYGVDLAKSLDYTVVIGLNRTGAVCHFDRWQSPWEATYPRVIATTGHFSVLVDSTGVGDPVLERFQKLGGPRFHGYKFSPQSKQQLMEGLAVAIQQPDSGLTFPKGPIVNELETYEYEYTRTGVRYTAPEGLHDDCVCALALAWEQYGRRPRGGAFRVSSASVSI